MKGKTRMHRFLRFCLLCLALAPMPAMASELLVIAVSGPVAPLEPGQSVRPGEALTLAAGARITLLKQDGTMQTLQGPFSGTPGDSAATTTGTAKSGTFAALKTLLGDTDARSTVLGAARASAGDLPAPPGIWHLSTDSSGPRCTDGMELVLWRRDPGEAVSVSARTQDARVKGLDWPAGEAALTLPEDFAKSEGRLAISLGGTLRELTLIRQPDALADAAPGALLSWLTEKGCNRQALALIDRVHAGAPLD